MKCLVLISLILLNCLVFGSNSNNNFANRLRSKQKFDEAFPFEPTETSKPKRRCNSHVANFKSKQDLKTKKQTPNLHSQVLAKALTGMSKYEQIQWFKSNTPLLSSFIRSFPSGISIYHSPSTLKRTLYIDGNDLAQIDWKNELNLLEFVRIENYFDEIHISNLLLDKKDVVYFVNFINCNSKSLSTLTLTDCELHFKSLYSNLSNLQALSCFKIRQKFKDEYKLKFWIINLPKGLKKLEIISTNTIETCAGLLGRFISQFPWLEEIRIENVSDNCGTSVESIFSLSHLQSVWINGEYGEKVFLLLPKYKPNWTSFSLQSLVMDKGNLMNLSFLPRLETLKLQWSDLLVCEVISFLSENHSTLPYLSFLTVEGNDEKEERVVIPESLVKRKMKISFNYRQKTPKNTEWLNYCLVSTGILLNLTVNRSADLEIIERITKEPELFCHLTGLIFYCQSKQHFQVLIELLSHLQQLKSLSIHVHCTTDEILPNNLLIPIFKDLQLDSLKITFFSVLGAERILSFMLECFRNSKTLSIQSFGKFDIRMISVFPILPMLKEISIEGHFNFNAEEYLFYWLSKHKALQSISVEFNSASQERIEKELKEKFSFKTVKKLKLSFHYVVNNEHKLRELILRFKKLNEINLSLYSESNYKTCEEAILFQEQFSPTRLSIWGDRWDVELKRRLTNKK